MKSLLSEMKVVKQYAQEQRWSEIEAAAVAAGPKGVPQMSRSKSPLRSSRNMERANARIENLECLIQSLLDANVSLAATNVEKLHEKVVRARQ